MRVEYDSRHSREAVLIERILKKLECLKETSLIGYDLILQTLRSQGYPTTYRRLALVSDRRRLEAILAILDKAIEGVLPGLTWKGLIADGTPANGGDPYIASVGEIILANGTNPFTITLPDPAQPENEKALITVKLVAGPGPVTVDVDGGTLVDGDPNIELQVEDITFMFHAVDGIYRVL